MGLKDKIRVLKNGASPIHSPAHVAASTPTKSVDLLKPHSSRNLMAPGQVTEQTLQVWRALPPQIRHDPSMVSFQMENERLHGSTVVTDDESGNPHDLESSYEDEHSFADSEYINMRKLSHGHNTGDERSTDGECTLSDIENSTNEKAKAVVTRVVAKQKSKERRKRERLIKRGGLLIFWVFAAVVLMIFEEKHLFEKTLEVPWNKTKNFVLPKNPTGDFKLKIFGTFNETMRMYQHDDAGKFLFVQSQLSYYDQINKRQDYKNILQPWLIPIVSETLFEVAPVVWRNQTYEMPNNVLRNLQKPGVTMRLSMYTNAEKDFAVELVYNPLIINKKIGTLLAAGILLIFYALLVWEVFQRTFVAIVCSILSVAVLACFDDRPNMDEIIEWMDMEMLTLLFCMMIIVGILAETGVFDYIAVLAFEISGGKIWPMIYFLCFITCFVSSFLDNVTTVILMTPVAIRLCEVMSLDPVPVLLGIIVQSNIGGSLTPIGDPISIIICSNHFFTKNGITFTKFVAHTLPGVILVTIQSCMHLRFVFRDPQSLRLNEPKEFKDLRREIKVWQRAANSLSSYSKDADLVRATLHKKVKLLKRTLRRKQRGLDSNDAYTHTLQELKLKYPIKHKMLLLQACAALTFVLVCFFVQSVPKWRTLPLGWLALLGVIALLIVLNRDDMEHLLHRIEWTTLLFFAAMFVMMECVERLGLFACIGELTKRIILFVDERHRLAMAIFIILWISALASAVLDSIPVTAMMVRVVVSLVSRETLGLPLEPLVWALTFGSSLGGNGTLYGASSNVVSAGIAEQHGYKITFTRYLKVVFPLMLGQIVIITAYLIWAHIIFEWHSE
ncbi:P protein [Bactrocera dorsalis]|uniref:P protein n=4 Tax=Bactrocera dorsalis TaxID=27457 RepID=A0A6I9VJ16_BACDO|nr:P protein [Bactrocera dorsalis]XP_029409273.2 P protein [Bactrocera dorsalis]XP_029409274.2 P protein [Bactrocera dorsalis]XP_049307791.1 P protein [Bactrocera dorsalis]XP_049307797.1 P protein [Bactrocera dorsalis]XP_049307809.1 P protein [Bactrocera dorsalis]XP_049307820.1 P protein [Bactrocera dorsalis]XP_049307825.1 P protein [Bactrocera dorsalis]XP_049307827.1 P protein [Bactrocera dorsalis]XP_049307829.1 P protein [Bactrocera dorsalis]